MFIYIYIYIYYIYIYINANTFKLQRTITNALRYKSNLSGNVINLSKHSFSFDTYKLLNKNLHFIPTSKRYNEINCLLMANQTWSSL